MMSISSPNGALCAASFSMSSKCFRPDAARVLSGPGGDGVHANLARSELIGEVAPSCFERRLDWTHHIVVRHDAIGAVVTHREHHTALAHQRRRELRHSDEGMAGNVHRLSEALSGTIEQPALKIFLGREGDRMDEDVEPAPLGAHFVEHRLQLPWDLDVDCAGD